MTWGKSLEEFDLFWLEEPLNPDDIMGHKKLADELNVPIALGEHVYNKYAFRDYIHHGALEYCQVDVTRVGGITEWLQVAGFAASYDVPVCPHVGDMGQIHQHLVASTPDAFMLEYIPWIRHIFEEPATVKEGIMYCLKCQALPRRFFLNIWPNIGLDRVQKKSLEQQRVVLSFSRAEGSFTKALTDNSHAEGERTFATGVASHVEGANTTAGGFASHAEGRFTSASGFASHAEGQNTVAFGDYSHSEGLNTIVNSSYGRSYHGTNRYDTISLFLASG